TVGPDGKTHTITIQGGVSVGGTEVAPALPPLHVRDRMGPGVAVGVVLTLSALGVVAALKRTTRGQPPRTAQLPNDSSERLERVERGMEAIAIEIERISEGQRFVTKMMAESRAPLIEKEKTNPIG
ncbi:MAG: hypothetical protein ACRD3J_31580, partial [Thermoanaerobaculia bacterium]